MGARESFGAPASAAYPGSDGDSETSDNFRWVWVRISERERIIRCMRDMQFIAQRRKTGGRWPWRSFWYFTTAAGASRLPAPFLAPAAALFHPVMADAQKAG